MGIYLLKSYSGNTLFYGGYHDDYVSDKGDDGDYYNGDSYGCGDDDDDVQEKGKHQSPWCINTQMQNCFFVNITPRQIKSKL